MEARARLAQQLRAARVPEVDEDGGARQPVKIRAERGGFCGGGGGVVVDGGRGGGRRPAVALRRERSVERGDVGVELAVAPGTTKVPSGTPARASTRSSTCRLSAAHCACASSGYGPSEPSNSRRRTAAASRSACSAGTSAVSISVFGSHCSTRTSPAARRTNAPLFAISLPHSTRWSPGGTIFMPRNFAPTE